MTPIDRAQQIDAVIAGAGWASAHRTVIAGDASARRYHRLTLGHKRAILMDAPPGQDDSVTEFLAIAQHLNRIGLSAPQAFAADVTNGILLQEDFGDAVFARLTAKDPAKEAPLYAAAVDTLVHLQSRPAPRGLPDLSVAEWAGAACDMAVAMYAQAITGKDVDSRPLTEALGHLITRHGDGPRVLILRDFHAENLIWLPRRRGMRRVGLLDFQLGQMGQPVYDLVSLLQDARRDVGSATSTAMLARFAGATGTLPDQLAVAFAVWGAQRALRILGVFARLCTVARKPAYLSLLPRVWGQLQANLAHPALAELALLCNDCLPAPTPDHLKRIAARCAPPSPAI